MFKKIGKYLLNFLISIDQLGNTLAGGDPDETISSRLGKLKLRYCGIIPWHRPVAKFIDYGLDLIDPNHSIDAIESDEGDDAVFDVELKEIPEDKIKFAREHIVALGKKFKKEN